MTNDEQPERARGIFGPEDRQYLRGEKQYPTDQGMYSRRKTIRQRLYDGILDFSVGQRYFSEWNWRRFIDRDQREEIGLKNGMVSAIAFFLEIHEAKGWDFSTTLRDALGEAYTHGPQRQMPHRIVEGVEYEAYTREPEKYRAVQERIRQKLDEGLGLTDHEFRVAVMLGDGSTGEKLRQYERNRRKEKRNEEALERVEDQIEFFD